MELVAKIAALSAGDGAHAGSSVVRAMRFGDPILQAGVAMLPAKLPQKATFPGSRVQKKARRALVEQYRRRGQRPPRRVSLQPVLKIERPQLSGLRMDQVLTLPDLACLISWLDHVEASPERFLQIKFVKIYMADYRKRNGVTGEFLTLENRRRCEAAGEPVGESRHHYHHRCQLAPRAFRMLGKQMKRCEALSPDGQWLKAIDVFLVSWQGVRNLTSPGMWNLESLAAKKC